jgi:hypothetical protein
VLIAGWHGRRVFSSISMVPTGPAETSTFGPISVPLGTTRSAPDRTVPQASHPDRTGQATKEAGPVGPGLDPRQRLAPSGQGPTMRPSTTDPTGELAAM